jgi:hypothetical protein
MAAAQGNSSKEKEGEGDEEVVSFRRQPLSKDELAKALWGSKSKGHDNEGLASAAHVFWDTQPVPKISIVPFFSLSSFLTSMSFLFVQVRVHRSKDLSTSKRKSVIFGQFL